MKPPTRPGDVHGSTVTPRNTPRASRQDREAEARRIAAALVSYARELPFSDDVPQAERLRRISTESSRLDGLDGRQWLIVIGDLRAAKDAAPAHIPDFIHYALHRLSLSHPREAFLISREMAGSGDLDFDTMTGFMRTWARDDAFAARGWLQENQAGLSERERQSIDSAFMEGALGSDPVLALEWHQTSSPGTDIPRIIERLDLSLEQRLALIQVLRKSRGSPDPAGMEAQGVACLPRLLLGSRSGVPATVEETSAFWKEIQPTPDEIRAISPADFLTRIDPAESVGWFQWVGRHFPTDAAGMIQNSMLEHPATAPEIRPWLESQPESYRNRHNEARRIATLSHAGSTPVASPVPGRAGYVFSPFTNRVIAIRGLPSGSRVVDPETGQEFTLP